MANFTRVQLWSVSAFSRPCLSARSQCDTDTNVGKTPDWERRVG